MARNEEKQLARLNRFYLQQQKEEELKKRPPRPKLETLSTVDDVKKWLPFIMKDIDFYITQMEVPCYPKRQIEEFERKISHLRGEYKAFVRKIHQLEPDLDVTPWSDRPYAGKRRKTEQTNSENNKSGEPPPESDPPKSSETSMPARRDRNFAEKFIPIATPVLKNDKFYQHCYGYEKTPQAPENITDNQLQDGPLQFNFSQRALEYYETNLSEVTTPENSHTDAPLLFNLNVNNVNVTMKDCTINLSQYESNVRTEDSSGELEKASGQPQTIDIKQLGQITSVDKCKRVPQIYDGTSVVNDSESHTAPVFQSSGESDPTDGEQKTNSYNSILKTNSNYVRKCGDKQDVKREASQLIPYSDSSSSDEET